MKAALQLKDKDKKLVIIIGFILFIVIDVVMIFFGWQCRSLFGYYKLAGERSQQIKTMENDIINKERYGQELSELDRTIDDLRLRVSDEAEVPVLMENISRLASAIGVRVLQIKPTLEIKKVPPSDAEATETEKEKFGEIIISIVAESGFHQLGAFISRLESEKNLFRLSSIEIQTDAKNYLVQNIRLSLKSTIRLAQQEQEPTT